MPTDDRTPEQRAYDVMNRVAAPGWGDEITQAVADAIRAAVLVEREAWEAWIVKQGWTITTK